MTFCHSAVAKLDHRLSQLDAGVVDEDVDRDALVVEALEGREDGGLVRDVETGLVDHDVRPLSSLPTAAVSAPRIGRR